MFFFHHSTQSHDFYNDVKTVMNSLIAGLKWMVVQPSLRDPH